jgi:hypothetical protein
VTVRDYLTTGQQDGLCMHTQGVHVYQSYAALVLQLIVCSRRSVTLWLDPDSQLLCCLGSCDAEDNGCAGVNCGNGSQCVDNTSPEVGYECQCADGTTFNGVTCVGECVALSRCMLARKC